MAGVFVAILAACVADEGCRSPTEITFTVTTDAKCSDVTGTSITVGSLADLENKPFTTTTASCVDGHVGSLVVVPSGSKDEEIGVRVVTGIGKSADDCVRDKYKGGCIVARRALRFIPHTPLDVPVPMQVACEDLPCLALQTCNQGSCVTAQTACAGGTCGLVVDAGSTPSSVEAGPDGESLAEGGPDADATASPEASIDASPDARVVIPPATRQHLVTVGDVFDETGTAHQQHAIYATHSGRWWLFFIDAASPFLLKTQWSTDFSAWTAGPSLTLTEATANVGENFSVAYADLGSQDVVHVAFSHVGTDDAGGLTERSYHARATITDDQIAFTSEVFVSAAIPADSHSSPDGCVTALDTAGHVYSATGLVNEMGKTQSFYTTGNMDIYESAAVDTGASWSPAKLDYVAWDWVPAYDNNRALVPLSSGQMLAFWPAADYTPQTSNIDWKVGSGSTWSTKGTVFSGDGSMARERSNDWSACAVSLSTVYAVTRLLDSTKNDTFQFVRFDAGASAWSVGAAIPVDPGLEATGIVLLTNGTELLLFAIRSDGALRYSRWTGTWSPWSTLFAAGAARAFLSGSGCYPSTRAAIMWTEGNAAPYQTFGAEVTSLF